MLKIDIDKLGIITSGLCAVHCLALPLALSLGLLGGFFDSHAHGALEWVVFVTAVLLAFISFYRSYRHHLRSSPGVLFSIGILVVLIGLVSHNHWAMGVGGLMMATGHFFNYHFLHANAGGR